MTNKYKAIVLGANGLIGRALVNALCADERYESITCLVRSPLQNRHFDDPQQKIMPLVIDFEHLQDYQGYFTVEHVFCCLGVNNSSSTDIRLFRRVNFEYIHVAAQLARAQRAKSFVWVSCAQADPKSTDLSFRVKGELESAIMSMPQLPNAAAVKPKLVASHKLHFRNRDQSSKYIVDGLQKLKSIVGWKQDMVFDVDLAHQMIKLQVF